jgi:very-short-patch-repair endonuclease
LRKNMTDAEKKFWERIRWKKLWFKFERQKPVYLYTENFGLDRYVIPDFICIELKIIVEIDWSIHNLQEVLELDLEKEKLLNKKWFKILRLTNLEIQENINLAIQKLVALFP